MDSSSHPRSQEIAGVFSDILTFLGGPRSCVSPTLSLKFYAMTHKRLYTQIGYRFALYEMKVLVFTMLRNFAFALPNPELKIEKRTTWVQFTVISSTSYAIDLFHL